VKLCKVRLNNGAVRVGQVVEEAVQLLDLEGAGLRSLSDLLHADQPSQRARELVDETTRPIPLEDVTLLTPVDRQEIWAAGVTYKRSQEARERESAGAARFYDLVYSAPRPELFFKTTAERVVGPGGPVRVRADSRWSVPEPELTLVLSPRLRIVGYTIGNDMSARDIEGENPLYLPQAKVYDGSCAVGPVVTLAEAMPPPDRVAIRLTIERQGRAIFEGATTVGRMARPFEELAQWLGRDNSFPQGALLLTGTGIVPPDEFSLAAGDVVHIDVTGVGRLTNPVEQGTC
jgi:2-dehydro-3-deoxy-D-arabinonate dehydratase